MEGGGSDTAKAEARALKAEANMVKAAELGKELLERNDALERELKKIVEEKEQSRYSLQLKLDAESSTVRSLQIELDAQKKEEGERKSLLRGEIGALKAELREARVSRKGSMSPGETGEALKEATDKEIKGLKEELRLVKLELEGFLSSSSSKEGDSFLSFSLTDLKAENDSLKQDLEILKRELEETIRESENVRSNNSCLRNRLQEKEMEVESYLESLALARSSTSELNKEMESLKMGEIDPSLKGNSLFSEVEDRRNFVEQKLQILQAKNAELKKVVEEKSQQIHRVKMQNLALLNLGGGGGITGALQSEQKGCTSLQIRKFEDQLSAEKKKNKVLTDNLELMTKTSSNPPAINGGETSEYGYLSSLLQVKTSQIDELKKKMQSQIRETLKESDKAQDFSRKLSLQEAQTVRLKAENYQLQMVIEDLKTEKSENTLPSNCKKSEEKTNLIFENIKFEEKDTEVDPPKDEIFLDLPLAKDLNSNKEHSKPVIKSVSFCQKIEVFDENEKRNEEIELELDDGLNKLPCRRVPKERSAISVEEQDKKIRNECAQQ